MKHITPEEAQELYHIVMEQGKLGQVSDLEAELQSIREQERSGAMAEEAPRP